MPSEPMVAVFNKSDEWVMRESEGEMGWFHRKFNPGTGAAVDTAIHGETTIAISGEDGKVIGHIVFREGPPPATAVLQTGSAGSTAPGQLASAPTPPQPQPPSSGEGLLTTSGATTSSPDPIPGGQSGSGSLPALPEPEPVAEGALVVESDPTHPDTPGGAPVTSLAPTAPTAPGAGSSTTEGSSGSTSSSPAPANP